MSVLLRRSTAAPTEQRFGWADLWEQYNQAFKYGGLQYLATSYGTNGQEPIESSFVGYTQAAYKRGGVVFACVLARMLLFSEARFAFRRRDDGELFRTDALRPLENPSPQVSTPELLARLEQDASLAGTAFVVRDRDQIKRLRPDWVTIVSGSREDGSPTLDEVDAEFLGLFYTPGGVGSGSKTRTFMANEVAVWAPIPDPTALHRGMSWITPLTDEIQADHGATIHKGNFFEHAATPNLTVSLAPEITPKQFKEFVGLMEDQHSGAWNAYKTLYLGGGAKPNVVGNTFEQMSFATTQGKGETRICAAAGVPPVIVGMSEGLQAATYSNYSAARRKFGDHWGRPQWRSVTAALSNVIAVPPGAELWVDDSDIPFLQEDRKDAAEITSAQATAIRTLTDAGFEPDAAISAVLTGDLRKLRGQHTGLFSVQLQPPDPGGPRVSSD